MTETAACTARRNQPAREHVHHAVTPGGLSVLVEMQLSLPRDARYVSVMRNVAACVLNDLNAPEDAAEDLELAITEACANAVKHATSANEYSVQLTIDHNGCVVEIIDAGPGFDPEAVQTSAVESPQDVPETGRGLLLIDALVDDLEFLRERDGTTIRLLKRWPELRLPAPEPVAAQSR